MISINGTITFLAIRIKSIQVIFLLPLASWSTDPINSNSIIFFTFSPSFPSPCSSPGQTCITLLSSLNISDFNHHKGLLSGLSCLCSCHFSHSNPAQISGSALSSWSTVLLILFPNFKPPMAPWSQIRYQLFCPVVFKACSSMMPKPFNPFLRKHTQYGSKPNTGP